MRDDEVSQVHTTDSFKSGCLMKASIMSFSPQFKISSFAPLNCKGRRTSTSNSNKRLPGMVVLILESLIEGFVDGVAVGNEGDGEMEGMSEGNTDGFVVDGICDGE